MKKLIFVVMMLLVVVGGAMAADVVPAVEPVAATNTVNSVINWIVSNQFIIAGIIVALLDFAFAINTSWKSNGILHFIYELAKSKQSGASE